MNFIIIYYYDYNISGFIIYVKKYFTKEPREILSEKGLVPQTVRLDIVLKHFYFWRWVCDHPADEKEVCRRSYVA